MDDLQGVSALRFGLLVWREDYLWMNFANSEFKAQQFRKENNKNEKDPAKVMNC